MSGTVPVETVTPVTMSEWMRLGCLTTTQAFDEYVTFDADGQPVAACALGAIAVARGITDFDIIDRAADFWFGPSHVGCPADPTHGAWPMAGVIIHLNDDHRWTREQIADWLEERGL